MLARLGRPLVDLDHHSAHVGRERCGGGVACSAVGLTRAGVCNSSAFLRLTACSISRLGLRRLSEHGWHGCLDDFGIGKRFACHLDAILKADRLLTLAVALRFLRVAEWRPIMLISIASTPLQELADPVLLLADLLANVRLRKCRFGLLGCEDLIGCLAVRG